MTTASPPLYLRYIVSDGKGRTLHVCDDADESQRAMAYYRRLACIYAPITVERAHTVHHRFNVGQPARCTDRMWCQCGYCYAISESSLSPTVDAPSIRRR